MVNKRQIAESALPYGAEADFTDEEIDEVLESFFDDCGFKDADTVVFHGGPSTREELRRLELFENTVDYLESLGSEPAIYFPEDSKELLGYTDIEPSELKYIDPEITEEDIAQSGDAEKSIHVSSDYHQEGMDWLLNQYDDRDYLVLGTETNNEDIAHWSIVGGDYTAKSLSEGKEAGRKLVDPRFE